MRTAQEIFDTVARHLLKQGKRSMDVSHQCLYRRPDGLQCAVGCLIPDDVYSKRMEQRGISEVQCILDKTHGPDFPLVQEFTEHVTLLNYLQYIHDAHAPRDWRAKLADFAAREGFTMPEGV